MLFQHTLEQVLSKQKTATSRLWKDGWYFGSHLQIKDSQFSAFQGNSVYSTKGKIRKVYEVGQVLSVQPARGQKGVAKIRILELAKRDVRGFTFAEIEKEGFEHAQDFIQLWAQMHDKAYYATMPIKTFDGNSYDSVYEKWLRGFSERPADFYEALVINFELVQEGQS